MDLVTLNKMLTDIVRFKNKLSAMDYSNEAYDAIEDELHEIEDEFNEEFGEYLEDVLIDIHEDLATDSEILLPTAYLADKYVPAGEDKDGDALFQIPSGSGVYIENDDDKVKPTIVIVTNPSSFCSLQKQQI